MNNWAPLNLRAETALAWIRLTLINLRQIIPLILTKLGAESDGDGADISAHDANWKYSAVLRELTVYVFCSPTAMAPAHRTTAFLLCLLGILLWIPLACAQDPESKLSYFDNLPARLFFFDDTTVRHLFEERIAHNSNEKLPECDIPRCDQRRCVHFTRRGEELGIG